MKADVLLRFLLKLLSGSRPVSCCSSVCRGWRVSKFGCCMTATRPDLVKSKRRQKRYKINTCRCVINYPCNFIWGSLCCILCDLWTLGNTQKSLADREKSSPQNELTFDQSLRWLRYCLPETSWAHVLHTCWPWPFAEGLHFKSIFMFLCYYSTRMSCLMSGLTVTVLWFSSATTQREKRTGRRKRNNNESRPIQCTGK